ncbi:MAG TPA: HAMP domain-containing sensor histidine kinase [Micropepsaceae bacterium]|jgi:signal transduction histidine kinase|nr:HAMP domain-containing sensor histidine kinase [Micropepsaceae bacterium]
MSMLLPRSLRARLVIGAFIWITAGISGAGIFISALFRQHATELTDSEMHAHLEELASLIDVNPQGEPELYRTLSDPRFSQMGSGYSWQVSRMGKRLIKSTSAATDDLPIPSDPLITGEMKKLVIPSGNANLIVYETSFAPVSGSEPLRLQVNVDSGIIDRVLRTFNISLAISLVLLAAALTTAAALQVVFGLQPMTRLGKALRAIRSGRATHLPQSFPLEVQPVVDDLNSLIDVNGQMVVRARAQAGNLAHALKTPLAVLADEADRLEHRGQVEAAQVILQQCQRMQRQIDYQIARTRAAASRSVPGVNAPLPQAVTNIVSAMRRLYAGKHPKFDVAIDPDCVAMCDPMDLNEMLANLIDNACKWCTQRVAIRGSVDASARQAVVSVEDDGPGLPLESREMVFQIGKRLDERVPGSGLGLPIVRDLAQLYGGEIRLEDSALGGLKAVLRLPRVG